MQPTPKRTHFRAEAGTASIALALARKFVSARQMILPVNSRRETFYLRFVRPALRKLLIPGDNVSSAKSGVPEVRAIRPGAPLAYADVREILIIKCDHLGDFVLAMRAMTILRRGFPDAKITLLCGSWNEEFALGSNLFDRIICVDIFSENSSDATSKFDRANFARHSFPVFDVALDLRMGPETRFLLNEVDARMRAGVEYPLVAGPMMDFSIANPPMTIAGKPNYASHAQSLLAGFAEGIVSVFPANPATPAGLQPRTTEQSSPRSASVVTVGINTGSGAPIKNWPLENFIAIMRVLIERYGVKIVLFGSSQQSRDGAIIVESMPEHSERIVNRIGGLSVVEFSRALQEVDLYIGHDSGGTHLAAMLGRKTLCLHAGVSPLETHGPIGVDVVVLKCFGLPCSPCGLRNLESCPQKHHCMRSIAPEAVIAEVRDMLGKRLSQRA